MAMTGIYDPENLKQVRLAQIAVIILTVAVGGYVAATTFLSIRGVWSAQHSLGTEKTEAAELSRKAAQDMKVELRHALPEAGGVDSFAVTFAGWAKDRDIVVESFTPEGAPAPSEITSDGTKLGTWNSTKVRVKGRGGYQQLMSLLQEFEHTLVPVRLESYALQSVERASGVGVTFDLLMTVYEQKEGAGASAAS